MLLALSAGFATSTTLAQVVPGAPEKAAAPSEQAAIDGFLARNAQAGVMRDGSQLARVYGVLSHGATPEASAQAFIQENAGMWGVAAGDLAPIGPFEAGEHLVQIMPDRDFGGYKFTGVYYTQQVQGIPVFRSHLLVLTRNEAGFPAVLAASTLWNVQGVEEQLKNINVGRLPDARLLTKQAGLVFRNAPEYSPAQYVIWAGVDRVAAPARLAVTFEGETGSPAQPESHQRYLFVVDAQTGEVLYREDRIYHAVTGTTNALTTQGFNADTCAAEVSTPLPYLEVATGGITAYSDANGNFSIAGPAGNATYTTRLVGKYFSVSNNGAAPLSLSQTVADGGTWSPLFNPGNLTEQDRAQVNAYRHANIIRDLALAANPSYPTVSSQTNAFLVTTNIASTCNAYYSNSTINFYTSGGGCANTAFGTVVHHEYGHNMVEKGGSGQGAYGEGMGDVMGLLVSDDPVTGIGFQSCSGGIRTAQNTCTYNATSCSSCGSEIHACGQLISGCVWDLRTLFLAAYPADYRTRIADLAVNSILLHGAISTIASDITIDYLTLDDDNGNILDGTPNYGYIASAFGAHGLPAPALQLIGFTYPSGRPVTVNPNGSSTLAVNVTAVAGTPAPGTGKLFAKVGNAASYTEYPMTATGANTYTVNLPGGACPSTLSYYVAAASTGGTVQTDPPTAPSSVFTATIAASSESVVTETFEASNGGWTIGAAGDAATTGVWVRADPIGTAAQPENDHTDPGSLCWFTGQGTPGGALGESDIDGGATTLTSAAYDCSGYDAVYLSYWRWYSNNTGSAPNADSMPISVSADNGATWVLLEDVSENANAWVNKTFRLNDYITPSSQVKVRFVARDLGSGSVVEAAIDDVTITGFGCTVANPSDLNGDGHVDGADLGILLGSWGTSGPADINGDGTVDGADLGIMLGSWG
ncbi:MAG: hypothetical protein U0625_07180 [Phycisphaerales bacterium]